MEVDKSGYNIVNKIDVSKVVSDFIAYYYTNINNSSKMISEGVIKEYTKIKYDSTTFTNNNINLFFSKFDGCTMNIKKVNFLDSGSRRIDIVVLGQFQDSNFNLNFFQTFILCNHQNNWYIKNSIFITS